MDNQKREILVFIPTYNESENVRIIYNLLRCLPISDKMDMLFVDDGSPDGTGQILDSIKQHDGHVSVLHRTKKSGIGSAHKLGIKWAYENGYDILITMDCDLTHTPEDIMRFLKYSATHDIVIGSRYLQKGSLSGWNIMRKMLTRFGHCLTTILLNMPFDASGAFRLYRLRKIQSGIFEKVESNSYSFFFESLLLLHINKTSIQEVPIHLPKRTYGDSKMELKDVIVSVRFLFKMFYKKTFQTKSLIINP